MHPRSALCGCCENNLLWDVETIFLYRRWRVGRSRLQVILKGCPRVSSGGIRRLFTVMSVCDCGLYRSSGCSLQCENWCRGGRLRKEAGGG
jgi:hypothetical protein